MPASAPFPAEAKRTAVDVESKSISQRRKLSRKSRTVQAALHTLGLTKAFSLIKERTSRLQQGRVLDRPGDALRNGARACWKGPSQYLSFLATPANQKNRSAPPFFPSLSLSFSPSDLKPVAKVNLLKRRRWRPGSGRGRLQGKLVPQGIEVAAAKWKATCVFPVIFFFFRFSVC